MTQPLNIIALAILFFLASFAVSAEEESPAVEDMLVVLSSGSLQTQGMAMVLSTTLLEKGARVSVLLCDEAGDLALKSYDAPALKPREVTPGQLLRGLISQGATVNVCALYLPNSEHSREDLFDGVGIAMPPQIADQLLDPDIRTLTF